MDLARLVAIFHPANFARKFFRDLPLVIENNEDDDDGCGEKVVAPMEIMIDRSVGGAEVITDEKIKERARDGDREAPKRILAQVHFGCADDDEAGGGDERDHLDGDEGFSAVVFG